MMPPGFKKMDQEFESMLEELCNMFRKTLRQNSLAFDCKLCLIDPSVSYVMKTDRRKRVDNGESDCAGNDRKSENKNSFDVLQLDELAIQG